MFKKSIIIKCTLMLILANITIQAKADYIAIPNDKRLIANAKKSGWNCEPRTQLVYSCRRGRQATLVPFERSWRIQMSGSGWWCNHRPNRVRFCSKAKRK